MISAQQALRRPRLESPPWFGRVWKTVLSLAIVVGGLWTATHGVAGVAWADVAGVLRGLPVTQLALLALIWVGGLGVYATVLSAALPGLGVRRSLLLNLSGSAVANVMPLGGAVATGMNWRMVRSWGHSNVAFASFCVLTNALDVATKLLLPVVAVGTLAFWSVHVPASLWVVAAVSGSALAVGWCTQALLLRPRPSATEDEGRLEGVRRQVRRTASRARRTLAERWARLLPGSVGYVAAQVVLLVFCLRAVGLAVPLSVVLMAAAIERLSTLVPLTPGGAGVAEVGTIAWLVANGLDPVEVVAGVLLYRIFLIAMEIPVGVVLLGGWAWLQRGREPGPAAVSGGSAG